MFHQTPHVVAAIVAATLLPIPAFAGDIEFGGFESAGPHNGLRSPALGDFNGDGILDLASVGYSDATLVIELGVGDGTFEPATLFPLSASGASAIVAADFNGDGPLDLAIAADGDQVIVMQGAGDGTFTESATLPMGSSSEVIAAADVDLDGDQDLVALPQDETIRVFLNDGAGAFESLFAGNTPWAPSGMVLADFNDDGLPDIAATRLNGTVLVDLGSGEGFFSGGTQIIEVVSGTYELATGDVNGDGALDLVAPGVFADAVSVLLGAGDGSGTFLAPVQYPVGDGPRDVAIFDVEGDLDMDIVTCNVFDQTVSVLLGDGAGGLVPDNDYPGSPALKLAVGDLNNDKSPDLVLGASSSEPGVSLINITSPAAPGPPLLTSPPDASTGLPLPEALVAWPGQNCDAPLDWDAAVGFGVSYSVVIATDPGLTNVVFETTGVDGLTFNIPTGVLLPGAAYYWTVSADNTTGSTPASNGPFTFSTAAASGPDINGDGMVDAADLAAVLAAWGPVF